MDNVHGDMFQYLEIPLSSENMESGFLTSSSTHRSWRWRGRTTLAPAKPTHASGFQHLVELWILEFSSMIQEGMQVIRG